MEKKLYRIKKKIELLVDNYVHSAVAKDRIFGELDSIANAYLTANIKDKEKLIENLKALLTTIENKINKNKEQIKEQAESSFETLHNLFDILALEQENPNIQIEKEVQEELIEKNLNFINENIKDPLENSIFVLGSEDSKRKDLLKNFYSKIYTSILEAEEPSFLVTNIFSQEELTSKSYDPETDYILNPYDERGINFNIMGLIEEEEDITSIAAAALSAVSTGSQDDKLWEKGGKDLFEGLLYMALYTAESNPDVILDNNLLRTLKNQNMVAFAKQLQKVVKKYPRANNALAIIKIVISNKTDKTAKSFLAKRKRFWDFFMAATKFLDVIKEGNKNPDIDLDQLIDQLIHEPKGENIFLANDKNHSVYSKIFMYFLIKKVLRKYQRERSLDKKIYLLLDNFSDFNDSGKILEVLSLLGKREYINYIIACQNIIKLKENYKGDLRYIIESFSTKIIMNVKENSSMYAAKLINSKYSFNEFDERFIDIKKLSSELNTLKTHEFYFKTKGTDWTLIEDKIKKEKENGKTSTPTTPTNEITINAARNGLKYLQRLFNSFSFDIKINKK